MSSETGQGRQMDASITAGRLHDPGNQSTTRTHTSGSGTKGKPNIRPGDRFQAMGPRTFGDAYARRTFSHTRRRQKNRSLRTPPCEEVSCLQLLSPHVRLSSIDAHSTPTHASHGPRKELRCAGRSAALEIGGRRGQLFEHRTCRVCVCAGGCLDQKPPACPASNASHPPSEHHTDQSDQMDVFSSSSVGEGASASTVGSLQREPERLRQEARALQGALEELYRNHYEVGSIERSILVID